MIVLTLPVMLAALALGGVARAQDPSFDCSRVEAGSIEELVCNDSTLAELDQKLAGVFAAALAKANNEHPPVLRTEQRGWLKGRDECWKSADQQQCVEDAYRRRIAELQARYQLVAGKGPFVFTCDGNQADEIIATFYPTDPPTLIAERGDSTSLMYLARSGSGTRYLGRNEMFWEHQGEALIRWGYNAPEMHCTKAQ